MGGAVAKRVKGWLKVETEKARLAKPPLSGGWTQDLPSKAKGFL